jgi:putative nucleotidyltransferase with HDIG domain
MPVPTEQECLRLIRRWQMLDHIVAHSRLVAKVGVLLVDLLAEKGIALDRPLVQAAGLLHDITKTRSFQTGENHAATGEQALVELGYSEVGRIVGQHVKLDQYAASGPPTEAEVVNYADKRVLHDKMVSLASRMAYIMQRYGQHPAHRERIKQLWHLTIRLEGRLFNYLAISPDQVASRLGHSEVPASFLTQR